MLNLDPLFEFSRTHCIAICAFLVPANLLATLQTMILTGLGRPSRQILQAAGFASCFALVISLHVLTWFMVGVVMAPTFILLFLAGVCLSVNFWAIAHPHSMVFLLHRLRPLLQLIKSASQNSLRIKRLDV